MRVAQKAVCCNADPVAMHFTEVLAAKII